MANQVMFQIGTQAHLESLFGTDIKWQVLSILVFAKAPVTSSETECICAYSNGLDLYDLHEGINGIPPLYLYGFFWVWGLQSHFQSLGWTAMSMGGDGQQLFFILPSNGACRNE
ncbi:hypothetical protein F5146DRAFT_1006141 [Armillaria mellea]|nr:hypothetical protein F5146DRAFT_1006141 [Armillaria mellea]